MFHFFFKKSVRFLYLKHTRTTKAQATPCMGGFRECGGGAGVKTPLEIHKPIGFLSNTAPKSFQVSIHCWASETPMMAHF